MKYAVIVFALAWVLVLVACGQTKIAPKPPVKKADYTKQIAECKQEADIENAMIVGENNEKFDLLRAAESRVLTQKEMARLLDFGDSVYWASSLVFCGEKGDISGSMSGPFIEEEFHKKFLDLLYQQARFRSIPEAATK